MSAGTLLATIVGLSVCVAGCASPFSSSSESNHPPQVKITLSPTHGEAPLNVSITIEFFDADGDTLLAEEFSYENGMLEGNGTTKIHGNGKDNTVGKITGENGYMGPGTYETVVQVHDGKVMAEARATVVVTGLSVFDWDHMEWANLTETCSACTAAGRESPVGAGALGGEGCQGFREGRNGADCVWFEVRPEWKGKKFYLHWEADADLNASVRTDCEPGAFKNQSMYLQEEDDGHLAGDINADAGCLLFWAHDKAPGRVRFAVG